MISYRNIQELVNDLQGKVDKLQAGNLTLEELIRLKSVAAEIYERIAILEYKVNERVLQHPDAAQAHLESGKVQSFEPEEKKDTTPVFRISTADAGTENEKQPVTPEPEVTAKPETPVSEKKTEQPKAQIEIPLEGEAGTAPLVEKLKRSKITDLKTAIPLNLKFLFMNALFEGENNSYNDALDKLNAFGNVDEARNFLKELSYIYNWDFEDERVASFTEFIERRHL